MVNGEAEAINFQDEPLKRYIDEVAAVKATPGGGSIAALVAALGAAAASMSAGFTIGGQKYKDVEPMVKEMRQGFDKGRNELLKLMEEDIARYDDVVAASRLPQATDYETIARDKALQEAIMGAVRPPLRLVGCCLEMLENIRLVADVVNPKLISDVGVAALCTNAALSGGKLNVDINLASVRDERMKTEIVETITRSAARAEVLLSETMSIVVSRIEDLRLSGH